MGHRDFSCIVGKSAQIGFDDPEVMVDQIHAAAAVVTELADKDREEGPHSGLRLFCASSVVQKILTRYDKELLLLIMLERYGKEYRGQSKWIHSVAVVRIDRTLEIEYFKGRDRSSSEKS